MTKKKLVLISALLIMLIGIFFFIPKHTNEHKPNHTVSTYEDTKAKALKEEEAKEKKRLKSEFEEYRKINSEVIGRIYIPGSALDEPIVQTKDNHTYLVKTFEGKNIPFFGAVFMDCNNNKNFKDPLTWLFAHARGSKVPDRRMFNDVNFYENQQFMDEHPFVVIETPEGINYYEVAFLIKVPEITELYRTSFRDYADFNNHMKKVFSKAVVKAKNFKLIGRNQYLVLSTCREDDVTLRTNLYCRKINDYEKEIFLEQNKEKLKKLEKN